MADIVKQVRKGLSESDGVRKIILSFALAGGLASMAVVWLWMQKPNYQLLYSNLSLEDAGAVVTKFKELNVPYQLSSDGTAVLVPSESVYELRLQLANQGLPQGGGIGFEIFDQTSFGTTEFVQKLNYRRALQGELARTISQFSAISKARVHLVVPKRTLFAERQERSRAAVVINLRPGQRLSAAQINGITHLVSSSVEGLEPQSVTVVDNRGQILTSASDASVPTQMTNSQLNYQQTLEAGLEKKIRTMLERIVGHDKAVVRVSSILDFRQVKMTEERFDPDAQVVRSEQRSQEELSSSSQSNNATGIPGVSSNIPPVSQSPAQATVTNQTRKKNEVINFEINKTVSHIIEPIGTIKRLSVAALIDGTYESVTNEEGETSRKYLPRTEEEMKKLEGIVKKAMGYSQERKDQVEVVNFSLDTGPFMEEDTLQPESTLDQLARWLLPLTRYVIGAVFALIILFSVIRPILKALTSPSPLPSPALGPAPVSQQLQAPGEQLQVETSREVEALKIAKENPQVATQVVKTWLKE